MTQAVAFDQVIELFSKVLSMVTSTLEGLGHEQHINGVAVAALLQILAEERAADEVDLAVGLEYSGGEIKVPVGKALVNLRQHAFEDLGDLLHLLAGLRGHTHAL